MPNVESEIFKKNPFATLGQVGVGQLMKMAVEKGNASRPGIQLGICCEHGGDPDSVKFCPRIDLNHVTPNRVSVARLATGQTAMENKRQAKTAKKK